MSTPHPIIAQLRTLRRAAGRSQDAIARRIGVDRRTVVAWETGQVDPRLTGLTAYAQALGYTLTLTPREEQ